MKEKYIVHGYGIEKKTAGKVVKKEFTKEEMRKFLNEHYGWFLREFGTHTSNGYRFDFKPYLKKYNVYTPWGTLRMYAPNQTIVRRTWAYNIVEIKEVRT